MACENKGFAAVSAFAFCTGLRRPLPPSTSGKCPLEAITVLCKGSFPSSNQAEYTNVDGLFAKFADGAAIGKLVQPTLSVMDETIQQLVKARLLPSTCGKDGGIVRGGEMVMSDVYSAPGPSDKKITYIPKEYQGTIAYLTTIIDIEMLLAGTLPCLKFIFCVGDIAAEHFFDGYRDHIDEICPEYLPLMANSNECHPSNFLFGNGGAITLDIKLAFQVSIARMCLESIGQAGRIPILEDRLRGNPYLIDGMMHAAVKETNRGMSHRGGKIAGPKNQPIMHASNESTNFDDQRRGGKKGGKIAGPMNRPIMYASNESRKFDDQRRGGKIAGPKNYPIMRAHNESTNYNGSRLGGEIAGPANVLHALAQQASTNWEGSRRGGMKSRLPANYQAPAPSREQSAARSLTQLLKLVRPMKNRTAISVCGCGRCWVTMEETSYNCKQLKDGSLQFRHRLNGGALCDGSLVFHPLVPASKIRFTDVSPIQDLSAYSYVQTGRNTFAEGCKKALQGLGKRIDLIAEQHRDLVKLEDGDNQKVVARKSKQQKQLRDAGFARHFNM